jgi:hypothetical protein
MPQHPQYSNSPEKNLEDLFKVLTDMEWFGFIHEEIYQPIESLMSDMYSEAAARFHRAENSSLDESEDGIEEDEEFESYGTVSVSDLWQYINESEKEQFIQDFRNAIAICMYENGHLLTSDNRGSDRLIELQDLEYYRMHINENVDLDTEKKYADRPRTVWFPSDVLPTRVGIYEVANGDYMSPVFDGYASWNGSGWSSNKKLLKDAIGIAKNKKEHYSWRMSAWRGFTEQVK